jgi:hypothetical protein
MCAFDAPEFATLYANMEPTLKVHFPRTKADAPADAVNYHRLTLKAILLLTLTRLRHDTAFRTLQCQVGFNFNHLRDRISLCEKLLRQKLFPTYMYSPSKAELWVRATVFHGRHAFMGQRFFLAVWTDAFYHLIPCPGEDAIQEVYYTGYTCIHAVKFLLFGATDRKWIYCVHPVTARTCDLDGFQASPFTIHLLDEHLRGGGDKGFASKDETRVVTPWKLSAISAGMRKLPESERGAFERACHTFNHEWGRQRCVVENMIGDLTRWAAARGRSHRTTFTDLGRDIDRVHLCVALTNFLYQQRGFA